MRVLARDKIPKHRKCEAGDNVGSMESRATSPHRNWLLHYMEVSAVCPCHIYLTYYG